MNLIVALFAATPMVAMLAIAARDVTVRLQREAAAPKSGIKAGLASA